MTRIFTDGAEMGDVLFWSTQNLVTCENTTPSPFASAYYYEVSGNNGYAVKLFTALSECYFRERIYVVDGNTGQRYPSFRSSTTELCWLSRNAGEHWEARSSGGSLASSAEILTLNQWYLVEIYFKLADAPDGRFVVYADGLKVIDFTGDTKPGAETTFDSVRCVGSSWPIMVDDVALNDTAGGVDDSYCGDGIVAKLTPNEDGAHNNWHGSDTNDVDNYLLVDEYPHDTDTTYVYHDASGTGVQDQYSLSNTDFSDKTILRVYPEARIRKTAAEAATVKLGILASGGTDNMSAAQNITETYTRIVGDEEKVNPVDSLAWEDADLDALEFVVEVG